MPRPTSNAYRTSTRTSSRLVVETREDGNTAGGRGSTDKRTLSTTLPPTEARLTGIQAKIKDAVKAGSAVKGSTNWQIHPRQRVLPVMAPHGQRVLKSPCSALTTTRPRASDE